MPRKKKTPVSPLESYQFTFGGEPVSVEVWENYPDEGKRGSHRRYSRAKIFDSVLISISERYYFSTREVRRTLVKRSLYDPRFKKEFVQTVKNICREKRIKAAQSTIYKVAHDVRKSLIALDNAIKERDQKRLKSPNRPPLM